MVPGSNNRVFYGEYSLEHWVDMILKEKVHLPDYQRYFVWDKAGVLALIDTLRENGFVPPVTIGSFDMQNGQRLDLILDGQQRLTSILLAYLKVFPKKSKFPASAKQEFVGEGDDGEDEEEPGDDNVLEWNFSRLVGNDHESPERDEKYEDLDPHVDEDFFKNHYLGFSYLVPKQGNPRDQQRYYSKVFRGINMGGKRLNDRESRNALYYLDENLKHFLIPNFSQAGIKTRWTLFAFWQ